MWHQTFDPNNRPYYFDDETNETTWEKPEQLWSKLDHALAAANWFEFTTENGKPYWYNRVTEQSVWQIPEEFTEVNQLNNGGETESESFESLLTRLDLKGTEYSQALPVLVKEPAFWQIGDATSRFKHFQIYQQQQSQSAVTEQIVERKERIARHIAELEEAFQDQNIDWPQAQAELRWPDSKEHIYAFVQWRTAAEQKYAAGWAKQEEELSSQLSQRLAGKAFETDWIKFRTEFDSRTQNILGPAVLKVCGQAYEQELSNLASHRLSLERADRKARQALRKRFKLLYKSGELKMRSEWKDIWPLIPDDELKAVCISDGSKPTELFWDFVSQLKRKFSVQVGVVEDVLTKRNMLVSELDLDSFRDLFSRDDRIDDVDAIYNYLSSDDFADRRRARRIEKEYKVLEY